MLHILVVEDRPADALPLCRLLLKAGHHVNVAADGEEALKGELADPPDVILLDLGLDKLDGFEVAAATRSVAWSRRPYIVALTGHDDDEHRRRAKAAGIDQFLVKPVNMEALNTILQKVAPIANSRLDGSKTPRTGPAVRRRAALVHCSLQVVERVLTVELSLASLPIRDEREQVVVQVT